ncbi:hypothetical protein CCHL11_03195, partial [Colletotrichum chlorophyti]
ERDVERAFSQRTIEALKAQVENKRSRKRTKVKTSPNSKFANIRAIQKAQEEAGNVETTIDESNRSESPSDEEDCIVVAVGGG